MGTSVNIYLEPHAKTEKIFEVILKILGHDFNFDHFISGANPDYNIPSGDKNSWYLTPKENPDNKIDMETVSWFICYFKDLAGNRINTHIHTDSEDGHLPICKSLIMDSSATWCAIGKRLVDFFGGRMMYNDGRDMENEMNWYAVETPKFPARNVNSGEHSDIRWHLYYNLLHNEKTLTAQEIKDMQGYSSYFSDKDKSLVSYFEKYEQMLELKDELNTQPINSTKKMIIKV
jgi:hypothetical protein